jgi:hypothetical protein
MTYRFPIVLAATLLLTLTAASQENAALFPVMQNQKYGYMNREGKVVIPFQFEFAQPFSEGRAQVTVGTGQKARHGFIDPPGAPIIPPRYYRAGSFSEGLAPVAFETKQTAPCFDCTTYDWKMLWGFIDQSGHLTIEAKFRNAREFHEGLAAVQGDSRKWGFIDTSGRLAIPMAFDYASSFSEGLAPAMKGNAWGYIDKAGQWAVEPKFTSVRDFHEGKAAVKTGGMLDRRECGLPCALPGGGNWMILDRKSLSTTAIRAKLIYHDYSEGVVPFYSGKNLCGYMDAEGKTVIPAQWEQCNNFSEGLALVKAAKHADYIDHSGRKALTAPAPDASDFHDGLAHVTLWWFDGHWQGYIDHTGKVVWSSGTLPAKKPK